MTLTLVAQLRRGNSFVAMGAMDRILKSFLCGVELLRKWSMGLF